MPDRGSKAPSATSTPNGVPVKKRISLNGSRNKKNTDSGNSNMSSEIPSSSPPGSTVHRASELSAENDTLPSYRSTVRPDIQAADRRRESHHEKALKEPCSPKRPRLSSQQAGAGGDGHITDGLPSLLSPTLPPTSTSPRLPQLLSPTLPPRIERELAVFGDVTPTQGSSHNKRSTDSRSSVKEDGDMASPKPSGYSTLKPDAHNRDFSYRSSPGIHSRAHSDQRSPRLIVRLKYGRPNKRRVEALLKFSGKGKTQSANAHGERSGSNCRDAGENKRIHSDEKPEDPSNLHPDESERGRSRHKVLAATRGYSKITTSSEEPSTPFLSSYPSASGKNEHGRNTLGVTANDRGRSHPAEDMKNNSIGTTHLAPTERRSAGHSETRTKSSPHSDDRENNNYSRNGERRAWRDESHKYGNLGRELKHAAERHTAKERVAEADEKLAAVTAIEAILCFILAFTADDQSKSLARQGGDSSTWLSIIAYWRVVKKNCMPYRELYSLCLILGAVSYEVIHALDLEQLAACAFPGDRTMAPAPGSVDNTVVTDDGKKTQKEFAELKERLPECYNKSRKLWIEGSRGLSEDVLTRKFPVTWSKRSTDYSNYGNTHLRVGHYSGEYFLPLGKISTPVEVVRFSWSILNEWCAKERVTWDGLLKL